MKTIKTIIGYFLIIVGLFVLGCIFPIMFIFYILWGGLKLTDKI